MHKIGMDLATILDERREQRDPTRRAGRRQ
jgi:hypothetical protein